MIQVFEQIQDGEPEYRLLAYPNMAAVSDGYHTFDELYRYRALYNAAWLNAEQNWGQHKSFKHSDGKYCFDAGGEWFIVVANLPTGQVSNHYHADYWDLFNIPERETAAEWDGHTPDQAEYRIEQYLKGEWGEI